MVCISITDIFFLYIQFDFSADHRCCLLYVVYACQNLFLFVGIYFAGLYNFSGANILFELAGTVLGLLGFIFFKQL